MVLAGTPGNYRHQLFRFRQFSFTIYIKTYINEQAFKLLSITKGILLLFFPSQQNTDRNSIFYYFTHVTSMYIGYLYCDSEL